MKCIIVDLRDDGLYVGDLRVGDTGGSFAMPLNDAIASLGVVPAGAPFRRCKACEAIFISITGRERFCGDVCRLDARRATFRKATNKGRERLRANRASREPSCFPCLHCGFEMTVHDKRRLYCSNACRQAAFRFKRRRAAERTILIHSLKIRAGRTPRTRGRTA